MLKKILPESLGFKGISIRSYEIVLITDTGEFMLDAVSGGISAIIDLGWQIFNYSAQSDTSITVLIDEIENHLHATMQRSILPSIINAFPNVQFIVSTHSPLIVGSVLNEVLGVPFTMPIWVENSLNNIVEKYSSHEVSSEVFKEMRAELKLLGLENLMPTAMDKTIEKLDDKNK